jgi:hypothetical protein
VGNGDRRVLRYALWQAAMGLRAKSPPVSRRMSGTARAANFTTIVPLSKPRAKAQVVNSAPDASKDATRRLARLIIASRFEDLPESVTHEAKRTLLNWVGCAIGGSGHETVNSAIAALLPFCCPGQASDKRF